MVGQDRENFRSGKLMIHIKGDLASRSFKSDAPIAYIVIVIVKQWGTLKQSGTAMCRVMN